MLSGELLQLQSSVMHWCTSPEPEPSPASRVSGTVDYSELNKSARSTERTP